MDEKIKSWDQYFDDLGKRLDKSKGSSGGKVVCTCGAKYTSNPKFHYKWCDLMLPPKPKKDWEYDDYCF